MPPEVGFRHPGKIPKLSWPPSEDELMEVNRWMKRIHESHFGHPAAHAAAHMRDAGTRDSLGSSEDPEDVSFGAEADPGDPRNGYAAADHVHALDADLESLEGLSGIETDEVDGASVQDIQTRRILELILVRVETIAEMMESLFGQNQA